MLRREVEKLNKAVQKGGKTYYNPDMPWDQIMHLATTDEAEGASEHRWWTIHVVEKTTLVATRVAPVSRYVDGDASVAHTHADHLATRHATATSAAQP